MRASLYRIPVPVPCTFARRIARVNPLIINYHIVSDKRLPHVASIYDYRNVGRFTEDIDFLTSNFHIIRLSDLLDSISGKTKLPANSMLLTFDDGFKEVYDTAAPILIDHKVFPTVFITKKYIDNRELGYDHKKSLIAEQILSQHGEHTGKKIRDILQENKLLHDDLISSVINIPYARRSVVDTIGDSVNIDFKGYLEDNRPYLTCGQLNELLKQGFTLGGHSIDHPDFTELTLTDQLHQAKESVDFVCRTFRVKYKAFAFPYWDGGISKEFFEEFSPFADATFGTQGLLNDSIGNNFQRIGIEKYDHPAQRIIEANYIRKILYRMINKDLILRPRTNSLP